VAAKIAWAHQAHNAMTTPLALMTNTNKNKYAIAKCSVEFKQWKRQNCIHADVYYSHYYSHSIWPFYPTTTYPWPAYSTRGICYQSDTLTQSAMLKAPDKFDFTAAQMSEINGLIDSGIFSIHPISDLPPKARLLNKIWSYRRKRSPTGAFLKITFMHWWVLTM